MIEPGLIVCICTYQRVSLLVKLIKDIIEQSLQPQYLVIIDGSPDGEVTYTLQKQDRLGGINLSYVPSNHANLAYQRYLGWRVARQLGGRYLLYFDDDLRLSNSAIIETLMKPFRWTGCNVAGVTAITQGGNPSRLKSQEILLDRGSKRTSWIVRLLGSAGKSTPGFLTPTGHRILPESSEKYPSFGHVLWMQGRVMLFHMEKLIAESFSEDLFAITHINCGLGEDTILSRRVLSNGEFWCWMNPGIEHPDADLPKSYPIQAYKLGYATSYSRRLINNNYRFPERPTRMDRISLLIGYLGNNLLNWSLAILSIKPYRFAFASGYLMGSVRGLFQNPTAKKLTPHINWWQDAEQAILRWTQFK